MTEYPARKGRTHEKKGAEVFTATVFALNVRRKGIKFVNVFFLLDVIRLRRGTKTGPQKISFKMSSSPCRDILFFQALFIVPPKVILGCFVD